MWALIHRDIADDIRKGIAMAIVINAVYVVFGEPHQQQQQQQPYSKAHAQCAKYCAM
jgi:hypothetical protein